MQGRSWGAKNRGLIAALMGAAVIVIATGLNDMLGGAIPRYEPLYLYLVAVALATWLSGVLLGTLSALLAVGFYGLLFMRRADALSAKILIPLGAALAVVLIVGIFRGLIRRRGPADAEVYVPAPAPMIGTSAFAMAAPDNAEVLAAIDELRSELRSAISDATAARTRERNLEHELAMYREAARIREEKLDRTYGEARDALHTRTRLLEVERDRTVQMLDEARARAERSEAAAIALPANYDEKLAAARDKAASLTGRVAELERALAAERENADAAGAVAGAAGERASDLEKAYHQEKRRADTAQTDARFMAGRVAELEKLIAARDQELDRASASGAAQLAQVEGSIEELQRALDAERDRADAEAAEREKLKDEFSHALAQREAAEKEKGDADARLHVLATRLANLEAALARAVAERDGARAETIAFQKQFEADQRLRDEEIAAERIRLDAEFDQKLQNIVAKLASDHEADRGQSLADREEARAEARGLSLRLSALQRKFDEEREKWLAKRGDNGLEARLAQAVAERDSARAEARETAERLMSLQQQFDAEHRQLQEGSTAERERLRVEFDQKLQTIVTHLASDHEADLGQALADKEAARAEARGLSQRLGTMQRKFDEEREKWLAARNQLTNQLHESEARTLKALEDARSGGAGKAAAQAEIDRLHIRVAELEKASRSEKLKPRVLIAHPDADIRNTASASLERAGYHVVSAADGLEALRIAMSVLPEVVIADSTMPKMDGRELCQLLKSQEKTSHIRVILLMRIAEELPKGELPPDEILRKPVPVETLKSTLASLLAAK
jgi:CheY-like chemotaxis protein